MTQATQLYLAASFNAYKNGTFQPNESHSKHVQRLAATTSKGIYPQMLLWSGKRANLETVAGYLKEDGFEELRPHADPRPNTYRLNQEGLTINLQHGEIEQIAAKLNDRGCTLIDRAVYMEDYLPRMSARLNGNHEPIDQFKPKELTHMSLQDVAQASSKAVEELKKTVRQHQ